MSKYQIVIISTLALFLLSSIQPVWSRGTGGGGGGGGESRGGFSGGGGGGGGGERGGAERGGAPHQSEPGGMHPSQNHQQQPNHPQGLPSDEGANHGNPSNMNKNNASGASGAAAGSAAARNNSSQHSGAEGAAVGATAANKNSPQHSGAEGAAAGAAVSKNNSPQYSGAQGAAAGAAAANRNSPQYSGAQGAAVGAAAANRNSPQYSGAQGAAAGAAVASRNSPQYSGAEGAVAGAAAVNNASGYGSGFGYVAPSARYGAATAVRGGYNNYGLYGDEWRSNNPSAWAAAGWGATTAWNSANWNSARTWCGYQNASPMYYNYGNNVVYQDDNVYVNGANAGTSSQYYDQVSALANAGAIADAPSDGDWLPLGVFALTMAGGSRASATVQIAVNKQSVVRGNYTDADTGATESIKGSVDPKSQRLAFTIGDDASKVIETGLYNLTKDESPALIHLGSDSTEQWLLVRLKTPAPPEPGK